ncbi:MAG: YkgJ family cysteine cluster protein [Syntrophorhabdaceae bacterium]|nr:YkgJ family cysteine cluster protein [Syntrophorhabdaceae bacterium]
MNGPGAPIKEGNNRSPACRQCGCCCYVDMVIYVTSEDMERWERQGRQDIIARLRDNRVIWAGDRIVDRSGAKVTNCVYLNWNGKTFFCEIYETRPMVCRNYVPGSSELCPLYYQE